DIPVVSLAALRDGDARATESTARAFGTALEEIGFVTIVDHDVPQAEVATVYGLAKNFFALPPEQKLTCMLPEKTKPCGYIPVGRERAAARLGGKEAPDRWEALVFRRPELDGRDGRSNLWPPGMPELQPAVLGYFKTLARLARDLYRLSETALDLPAGYLAPYFEEPAFTLRLVNYPEQPTPPKPGQLRYGAHHDYRGLTILHPDDPPRGLHVLDRSG